MKLKTKHITVTAVMIALSIVVIQFIKAPLMIAGQNVAISGALINLILIIDTPVSYTHLQTCKLLIP